MVTELDLPVYEPDPDYRTHPRCDSTVLWTYERMMQKTEVYCEYREFF